MFPVDRDVQGTCPACGSRGTLFIGDGGFITCVSATCPQPRLVADYLDQAPRPGDEGGLGTVAERVRETLLAVRDLAPDALSDDKVDAVARLVARGVGDLARDRS